MRWHWEALMVHLCTIDVQQWLHAEWYWLCSEGYGQSLSPTTMSLLMLEGKIDNLRAAVTAAILKPLMQGDPRYFIQAQQVKAKVLCILAPMQHLTVETKMKAMALVLAKPAAWSVHKEDVEGYQWKVPDSCEPF